MTVHFVTGSDWREHVEEITQAAVEAGQGYRVRVQKDATGAHEAVVTVFEDGENDA